MIAIGFALRPYPTDLLMLQQDARCEHRPSHPTIRPPPEGRGPWQQTAKAHSAALGGSGGQPQKGLRAQALELSASPLPAEYGRRRVAPCERGHAPRKNLCWRCLWRFYHKHAQRLRKVRRKIESNYPNFWRREPMLKTLISLSVVAALTCTSVRAADNSPILGKTIELRAELMVTDTQGTATTARTEPLVRRIHIGKDGAISVGSESTDGQARARLNQTMYLPSPPDL